MKLVRALDRKVVDVDVQFGHVDGAEVGVAGAEVVQFVFEVGEVGH